TGSRCAGAFQGTPMTVMPRASRARCTCRSLSEMSGHVRQVTKPTRDEGMPVQYAIGMGSSFFGVADQDLFAHGRAAVLYGRYQDHPVARWWCAPTRGGVWKGARSWPDHWALSEWPPPLPPSRP